MSQVLGLGQSGTRVGHRRPIEVGLDLELAHDRQQVTVEAQRHDSRISRHGLYTSSGCG
jgi:hypothetical protein